jgi:DNA replication protein DnaC
MGFSGETGVGKSWIAQAFGHAACRQALSVCYERKHRLLELLRLARSEGTYHKRLAALARMDLLILDDFGLKPHSSQERHDLLEVIEDQHR